MNETINNSSCCGPSTAKSSCGCGSSPITPPVTDSSTGCDSGSSSDGGGCCTSSISGSRKWMKALFLVVVGIAVIILLDGLS